MHRLFSSGGCWGCVFAHACVLLTVFNSWRSCWLRLEDSCSLASRAAIFSSLISNVDFRVDSSLVSRSLNLNFFYKKISINMIVQPFLWMVHVFKGVAPVVRAFVMKQPFLVETNLLQLMSQFLQVIVHLLSSQFLADELLKHTHQFYTQSILGQLV